MIEINLEYEPVLRAWGRAASVMGNTRPLMRDMAGIMHRAVEDNFEQEGRPKWRDLASSTKLSYQVNGRDWRRLGSGRQRSINAVKFSPFGGRILQRSGQLAASIVQSFDAQTAVVGTNKIYAAIHQFGGRTKAHVIRAKNKRALSFGGIVVRQVNHPGSIIPARPFLLLAPRDLRDMVEASRLHYARALARNGLLME